MKKRKSKINKAVARDSQPKVVLQPSKPAAEAVKPVMQTLKRAHASRKRSGL